MDYLLEDTVVDCLVGYLSVRAWKIESYCIGRKHGTDICASRNKQWLLVEANGGKGNPRQQEVVRNSFDSGQIKYHLGKAIVKVLELKTQNPDALLLIAHPYTEKIYEIVLPVANELKKLEINFCFLQPDGKFEFLHGNYD